MAIRLLPIQIPQLWDAIKFASVNVDRIPEKDQPLYLRNLLIALLNDKAQCFIHQNGNRQLVAIAITRINQDIVTGEKALLVSCLYSFGGISLDEWTKHMELVKQFARNSGCKKISFYSNNERVYEMVRFMNFVERFRCFTFDLEA
jgi:hypothetical protein